MRLNGLLLLLMLSVGCDRAAPPPAVPTTAATQAPTATADATSAQAPAFAGLESSTAQVAPPSAGAVLAAIYGEAGDGSAEYALADGRTATFWAGHAYRFDGQERYTAFAHTAAANETGFAAPGEQVALAQLTYTLENGNWRPGPVQTDVGRFGGAGRGPEFDRDRKPETFAVSAERALLAMPSRFFATGNALYAYQLFGYAPAEGRWHYLGQVASGEDASASCADGPSTPATECVRNTGTLRFLPIASGAMPEIEIARVGSIRGDDGAIRLVGAGDALRYIHDSAGDAYIDKPSP